MKEALTKGILVLTVLTFVRSVANTGVSAWLPRTSRTSRSRGRI